LIRKLKKRQLFILRYFLIPKLKINTITNTPSGDCDIVTFKLVKQEFMAISAGPYFKFNPAVSLFVTFNTEAEIDKVWQALVEGGEVLMEYSAYPWAKKYGWLKDKYGLSWQLSYTESNQLAQKITPALMFTKEMAGKAKEAILEYTEIFPNSKVELMLPYEKGEGDEEGFVKHSRFTLLGQDFIAMDSSAAHDFIFNEAVSFIVNCDTQEEIDYYWDKLSAVPEAEQCGWLKDKYGVSWQIVPSSMDEMMSGDDKERTSRVTQAFLQMKKFDIAKLKEVYEGN
jgi:predicted 3-demethylubiquinone-9 3-methyltransferase (glyoxalase superfamily)